MVRSSKRIPPPSPLFNVKYVLHSLALPNFLPCLNFTADCCSLHGWMCCVFYGLSSTHEIAVASLHAHTPTPSCRALNSFRAIVRIYSIRPTDRSDGKVTCKVGGTGNNNRTSRPGNYAPAPPCSRCLNAQLPVVHEQTAQIANRPKSYELRAPLGRSD